MYIVINSRPSKDTLYILNERTITSYSYIKGNNGFRGFQVYMLIASILATNSDLRVCVRNDLLKCTLKHLNSADYVNIVF